MPSTASASKKTPSLKSLSVKLKEIQTSMMDIWKFIESFPEDATISKINVRLEKLDELWERFSEVLVEIKCHEDYDAEDEAYDKERLEFNNRYYEGKAFLMEKVREREEPVLERTSRVNESATEGALDNVRLPQIKLQTFNGEIDDWLSFRDLFTSLIHWKTELPEVEKFHYLKGCLQGEPKNMIDPLKITKANYLVAWEMLLKRYNNCKQLKKRQIQSLFSLPTLARESVGELHTLLESFERVVQTLDQIVQSSDYKDLLLVNILTTRLDPVTRRGWEEASSTKEQDTLEDLLDFLHRRIRVLESLPAKTVEAKMPPSAILKPRQSTSRTSFSAVPTSGGRCVACSSHHPLFQCSTFQGMSVADRDGLLKGHALCRNCFRIGHQAKECQSKYSCRNCKGRHHTLVCFKVERLGDTKVAMVVKERNAPTKREQPTASHSSSSQVANVAATKVSVSNATHQYSSQVLLATAVIIIEDDEGVSYPARALLDSGSESNFISERLCQCIKVSRKRVDVSVSGIGLATMKVKHRIHALVRSRVSDFSRDLEFLVLPKVTVNLPTTAIKTSGWSIPEGVELADPAFFQSKGVDVVLGIEAFFDFFTTGKRMSLGEQLPSLNHSVFGWVVCGGLANSTQALRINCNVSTAERLDAMIERFWSCEEIEEDNSYSPEEKRCEELFQRTVYREKNGRYTVALPKNDDRLLRLGQSKDIAFRRLRGTERRLARDTDLRTQYTAFMDEYLEMGHMRKVNKDVHVKGERCFLPHHPVVKAASTTTKVRVVFDASCKSSSGISLNDTLLAGPVIQEDLRSIVLRCRTRQIMVVSDVEKMFRQIRVRSEDRPLQSILWRSSPSEEVEVYELGTVTYGTKPAPFLATRVLQQLSVDEEGKYPLAARAVREDTYMDDVITGANDTNTAKELRIQLDMMMLAGGFRLRKWASNCTEVLDGIPQENLAIHEGVNLDPDPAIKTLGLTWVPKLDIFRFQFCIPELKEETVLTKRTILSIIATLFDPLGLLGAAVTSAKILMQQLWTLQDEEERKLEWDQPVPSQLEKVWRKFLAQLPILNKVTVQRCIIIPNAAFVEMHCFSDASERAYGACVYIRSQNAAGDVVTRLLTSKSKVAPLKRQTIPRLELCGARLAAQLYDKVKRAIKIPLRTYFWTDSTCVLRWIQASPANWTTYVANRVSIIQTLTENCYWSHVPGVENPADLISRGISPEDILSNSSWWQGPQWLHCGPEQWPETAEVIDEAGKEERRLTIVACNALPEISFIENYISKFTTYSDMICRTAYWLRLRKLLRKPRDERKDYTFLSTTELLAAENSLIRLVQAESFAKEIKALKANESVPTNSRLRWYSPRLSEDGLIRLGGRLEKSNEAEGTKHPILLPARHAFTRKLLQHYHERLLHAGPQLMLGAVRLHYWPLGGRQVARQIVHRCVKCFRSNPTKVQQYMGELPSSRVTVARPFARTGIDYFGPVYVRPAPRKHAVKAYVALFICLCTKAVHLELVTDLSTDRFLQALRRFVARRGRCSDIYSDNGTNFVGARNKLQEFLKLLRNQRHHEIVARECASEGIQWHFTPPGAPHFGGLWEAAVKSAKRHLLKLVGENPVSPEDFITLLTQVEGCLNSRPLTPMSDDPNDLEPLTPSHFLVGSSLQAIPEPNLESVPFNRLNQWQQMQRNLQEFWRRWRREYLNQLQARQKRWKPPVQIQIGKLVVIQDDNLPPMRWRMGRITAIHPGDDNVVRVVTVKTSSGVLVRPVEKLCILPVPDGDEELEMNATPTHNA
ncbi:uncharacterized protein LOC129719980 [Wyeomyia smithii]|uniref:uncharacterized protein LOC129719980 n=1 Tax=Wyeomyia smithii TaxID=174621 RepID=UPI002467BFD6|nr:uncharacterized protein LOC129719980 [Wyeomyia smithii]